MTKRIILALVVLAGFLGFLAEFSQGAVIYSNSVTIAPTGTTGIFSSVPVTNGALTIQEFTSNTAKTIHLGIFSTVMVSGVNTKIIPDPGNPASPNKYSIVTTITGKDVAAPQLATSTDSVSVFAPLGSGINDPITGAVQIKHYYQDPSKGTADDSYFDGKTNGTGITFTTMSIVVAEDTSTGDIVGTLTFNVSDPGATFTTPYQYNVPSSAASIPEPVGYMFASIGIICLLGKRRR